MRHLPRINLTLRRRAAPHLWLFEDSANLRCPPLLLLLFTERLCPFFACRPPRNRYTAIFLCLRWFRETVSIRWSIFVLPLCVFKKFPGKGEATHFSITDIVKTVVGLCSFFERFSDFIVFPNRQRSKTSFNTRTINDWKNRSEIYICKSKVIETSKNMTK